MIKKITHFFSSNKKKSKTKTKPPTTSSSSAKPPKAYFSPGEDCLNGILETLREAESSIDICVFTISDNRISNEIINSHLRGIRIRVLTDNTKSQDIGSDISEFARKGISVKTDNTEAHLHHKFAVIDKKTLINGSYNWTRSAAEYNEENIVITYDPTLTRQFMAEFEKLWKKSTIFGG